MSNTTQQRISKTWGAASAALTLVVVLGLGAVTTQSAQAQTFTDLYNFTGSPDGAYPYGGLVRDGDTLYGTTHYDGADSSGTVFKVNKKGVETVLYSFTGGADGGRPFGGLVRDAAGNLYGTTWKGGASGYGTVFKVSKEGVETVLYSFGGGTTDGCYPYGGLLMAKAKGILYGTTAECGTSSYGTVFALGTDGEGYTVLHNFAGGSTDGASPLYTSLIMDKKGVLYGVTDYGGATNQGVVYQLTTSGTLTLLWSFAGGTSDGCIPYGTPAVDKKGDLYGTTDSCGASNYGIVWKVTKNGTETVLHSFAGGSSDGENPIAGVILDATGNLYGDTELGGTFGLGTVYELSEEGTLTLLHSFDGSDGENPFDNLIMDAKGTLYGTCVEGGVGNGGAGNGTVWKIAN